MKLLLDQGLPRSTVSELEKIGIESVHVGDIGMVASTDSEIIQKALQDDLIVITLDSDFHSILAVEKKKRPSVIRIRIEGLKSKQFSEIINSVIESTRAEIKEGAAVSVTENGIRIHSLPLV